MRCQDLQGIHFVRQLTHLDDKQKQQAEVCTYFQKFEEAQQIYIGMERPDLALKMRRKLGDWFRVVQLIKNGAGGDDQLLNQACEKTEREGDRGSEWSDDVKRRAQMLGG